MARTPKPWYRAQRDEWTVWLHGKQHRLAKGKANRAAALKAFHALMAQGPPKSEAEGPILGALIDAFLKRVERDLAPLTLAFYRQHLLPFGLHAGAGLPAADVRPYHVTRWVESHPGWGDAARHNAITAAKALMEWGRKQGYVAANPLRDMERPATPARARIATAKQADAILAAAGDEAFRDFLTALRETGARPSEMMRLEARHLDLPGRRVVMPGKTSRVTRKPRVIYLSEPAAALLGRLAERHPEGPLLRNARGASWKYPSLSARFRRLRKALGMGKEATAASFRHLFVTQALERGVPIATVAELAGHTTTGQISRTYSHLHRHHEHLLAAVERTRAPLPSLAGEEAVGRAVEPQAGAEGPGTAPDGPRGGGG